MKTFKFLLGLSSFILLGVGVYMTTFNSASNWKVIKQNKMNEITVNNKEYEFVSNTIILDDYKKGSTIDEIPTWLIKVNYSSLDGKNNNHNESFNLDTLLSSDFYPGDTTTFYSESYGDRWAIYEQKKTPFGMKKKRVKRPGLSNPYARANKLEYRSKVETKKGPRDKPLRIILPYKQDKDSETLRYLMEAFPDGHIERTELK